MGRLATLESSRVRCPVQPASTNPAVEWMRRPKPTEGGLALQPGDEVVGQGHLLGGRAEHELAGMEDEWVVAHVHQFGEVLLVLANVDHPAGVVTKQPEIAVHMQVDRRGLHARLVEGIDADLTRPDRLENGAVGEDHAAQTIV